MRNLSIPIRFGIVMSACLIAYFLILSIFNLHIKPIFSIFNGVIVGFGIYEVIHITKLKKKDNFNYTEGFTAGLVSGMIATFIFTVFFTFFATEVDTNFISNLIDPFNGNYSVHIGLIAFVVAIMGLSTTVVLTLTAMQLFKPSITATQNA